jgi:predicted amidohydrolase YtcJ
VGELILPSRVSSAVQRRNYFAIDPFDIHDTTVLATHLDGREVYAPAAH